MSDRPIGHESVTEPVGAATPDEQLIATRSTRIITTRPSGPPGAAAKANTTTDPALTPPAKTFRPLRLAADRRDERQPSRRHSG